MIYEAVAGSVALLFAMLVTVSALVRRFGLHPELARKTIHVGLGLYCLTFPLLFSSPWPVLAICGLCLLLLLCVRLARVRQGGIGAGLHGVLRESYGELIFGASVALLFVLGRHDPVTYVLPLAILTLSDAAAALVGVRYGRATFQVAQSYKSLEGAAVFFMTACIICLVLLLLMSDASRLNVIVLSACIAAYGTLVEATSWRGWDNFFLPVAIHLVLAHHVDSPTWLLLGGATIGAAGLAAMLGLRRMLGLDVHSAVFVTALLATIGMASSSWNLIAPGIALGCHLLADPRRRAPEPDAHLKLGLVILMLALGWYLVADLTQRPTVFAFNMTFAALGVALLASRGRLLLALSVVPFFGGLIEARSLIAGARIPTDELSVGVILAVLVMVALAAAAARLRGRPVACEAVGLVALFAGASALPMAQ